MKKSNEVHSNKYHYSEVIYEHSNKKVKIICPINNHGLFLQTPSNHMQGSGCQLCASSKNELLCKQVFEEYFMLPFKKTKPKFLEGLEYDGFNEDIGIAFEYNGMQHYKSLYGNEYSFMLQKERDERKIYLSKINKTTLIIIPYYAKDIKQYILEILDGK